MMGRVKFSGKRSFSVLGVPKVSLPVTLEAMTGAKSRIFSGALNGSAFGA